MHKILGSNCADKTRRHRGPLRKGPKSNSDKFKIPCGLKSTVCVICNRLHDESVNEMIIKGQADNVSLEMADILTLQMITTV